MPFGVFAKDYSIRDSLSNTTWNDGDSIDLSDAYGEFYNSYFIPLYFSTITYNGYIYRLGSDVDGVYLSEYSNKIDFSYNSWLLEPLEKFEASNACFLKISESLMDEDIGHDVCSDSEEYKELMSYFKDSSNKPVFSIEYSYYTSGMYNGLAIHATYPDNNKETILNISYNNVENSSKESIEKNPIKYSKKDGTIVLKDLVREGFTFEGWYLDEDFKYKVSELNVELFNDYFSDDKCFENTDVEKLSTTIKDYILSGKINLYAKWSSNNVITNPKTWSTIELIFFVLSTAIITCIFVFLRSRKVMEG